MLMERREFEARHNCDLVEKKSFFYLRHLPKQGKSVCSHFVGISALFNCKAIYLYLFYLFIYLFESDTRSIEKRKKKKHSQQQQQKKKTSRKEK